MKIRVRDIFVLLFAAAALVLCGMQFFSGVGAEETGSKITVAYMALNSLMIMLFAVMAILQVFLYKRAQKLQTVLWCATALVAGVYTFLVIVESAELIATFIPKELWNAPQAVLFLVMYLLYLAQGITGVALCAGKILHRTKNHRFLGGLMMFWVAASSVPTVITVFEYQISNDLRAMVLSSVILPVVIQALAVYGAFCNRIDETE